MQLSKYISYAEACATNTKLANSLPLSGTIYVNAYRLANNILDVIREYYNAPLIVHSFYRCPEVNKAVGGAATSQHVMGQACDFHIKGVELEQVYADIANGVIKDEDGNPLMNSVDQIIYEVDWIHISTAKIKRNMKLVAVVKKGKVTGYKYWNSTYTMEDYKNE